MFAEVFVREALMVPGNAMATAHNIQTKEMLYRWGFVADLINYVSGLPVILIFYLLFRRVNKYLALLALFFVLIQTAIGAVNLSNQLSPLLFLSGEDKNCGAVPLLAVTVGVLFFLSNAPDEFAG